jgi:hypothetical protein
VNDRRRHHFPIAVGVAAEVVVVAEKLIEHEFIALPRVLVLVVTAGYTNILAYRIVIQGITRRSEPRNRYEGM